MKNFFYRNPLYMILAVIFCLVVYAIFSIYNLPRPKGLRIHSPASAAVNSSSRTMSSEANQVAYSRLSPASFSVAFGLDFYRQVQVAPIASTPVEIIKQADKVAKIAVASSSPTVNLAAAGYRLKGIVMEKDGNSTVFVYDPDVKKVVIAREKSADQLRVVEVSLRSARLMTPHGEGLLELDSETKTVGSLSMMKGAPAQGSPAPAISQSAARTSVQTSRQQSVSASAIADIINAGHFNVSQNRGKYSVEVKKIPDSFVGYGLLSGDQIVGTNGQDFRRSQDIALELGELEKRPVALKILRKGKVVHLSPPPLKAPVEEKKQP